MVRPRVRDISPNKPEEGFSGTLEDLDESSANGEGSVMGTTARYGLGSIPSNSLSTSRGSTPDGMR